MDKDAPSPSRVSQEQELTKGWWERLQDEFLGGVANLIWSESKRTISSSPCRDGTPSEGDSVDTYYNYGCYGRVHPLHRWF